ncbi:PH domain-containing protein [Georgenia sp. MJ170]|uniref:PH domain-containing protein n=1 Tax=Georgenia sunbinii TaxID=3117728 RepID=UPI002F264181
MRLTLRRLTWHAERMAPTGEASDDTGALPARQTWHPARRRLFVTVFSTLSVLNIVLAIVWLNNDEMGPAMRIALPVLYAGFSVVAALAAWSQSRTRLEADLDGLHLVIPPRRTTYRWEDISEIRPSILKGRRTYLVLVQRDGETIDLPVTEEHLSGLQRWHQAAP